MAERRDGITKRRKPAKPEAELSTELSAPLKDEARKKNNDEDEVCKLSASDSGGGFFRV